MTKGARRLVERDGLQVANLCRQNQGTLSKRKRELSEFSPLTDREISELEAVVRYGMGITAEPRKAVEAE